MKRINNLPGLKGRRKELRQNETPQEQILWWHLRAGRLDGHKFKRQHSIGGYILDFYCAKKKLIIELDGAIHNSKEAQKYDSIRDKYFTDLGFTVLRFPNSEVDEDVYGVLTKIKNMLPRSNTQV